MYYASSSGDIDVVTLLLDSGADVNVADNNGETPLHCASSSGTY